ncbi:hypothetical protein [Paracidovorax citrulli]|uniref:hypothetical protein n=1 Tax=Paracidovorax citrulli TaxID=80869 RepID=UPI000BC337DE|nr:hypothetical protein [Paracidovorax citrulli]ATG92629.1 hypothetical protein CQB05_00015 [Paracidovorax citrulli]
MADRQISTELKVGVTGRESITGLADDLDDVAKVLTGDLAKSAQGPQRGCANWPTRTRRSPRS